jgi:transposase InsO family protein
MKKRSSLKGLRFPSESSIGRYLHQWERFRRRRKFEVVRERLRQAQQVHQRWQIDFKMEIPLKDGSLVNLCTIRDPIGEACIGAFVFPAGRRKPGKRVTLEQLRCALRLCFARWNTLPKEVQTDNEALFVGAAWDPFPSQFTLWLLGLGIAHVLIRSGKPTDNAEVERCHRTINEYAIIGNEDADPAGLQAILDEAVEELCFQLPSRAEGCRGLAPIQAHPELMQPQRPFQPENELALFNLQAVDAYLATLVWQRKVGKTGQITMSGARERYSVGRAYARQQVLVRFDPLDRHYVFFLPSDLETEIGRKPARKLDIADLTGFAAWPVGLGSQQLLLPLPFFQGVDR